MDEKKEIDDCHLIDATCESLSLGIAPKCAAMVFYHRFISKRNNSTTIGVPLIGATILLASKIENCRRHVKDVAYQINLQRNSGDWNILTLDIIAAEVILMKVIEFNVGIELPYTQLLAMGREKRIDRSIMADAWNNIFLFYFSRIVITFSSNDIAKMAMALAMKNVESDTMGVTKESIDLMKSEIDKIRKR